MVDLGRDLCQKEFIIVSDDSCHEYIIPLEKYKHWYTVWWGSEDFENGIEPDYAIGYEGLVAFKEFRIV